LSEPKPRKTERELLALLHKRSGVALKDLTIVPGPQGYWNVRPLRAERSSHVTSEERARFAEIVEQLREEFDLKTE
jgi:hypothetical protein